MSVKKLVKDLVRDIEESNSMVSVYKSHIDDAEYEVEEVREKLGYAELRVQELESDVEELTKHLQADSLVKSAYEERVDELEEQKLAHSDFLFSLRAATINKFGQEAWTNLTNSAYSNLQRIGVNTDHIKVEYSEDEDDS